MADIISKISQYNLIGRGCCSFPTATKWQLIRDNPAKEKYIICNVSEGEPAVFKDGWILDNKPEIALEAIEYALKFFKARQAIIYLREDYFKKYRKYLKKLIGNNKKIELFKETGDYIGGEETALIESIEGKRVEPRLRPPYPPQVGLYGQPTLVNNLETFYDIGLILRGEYETKRLICLSGQGVKPQVHELPENWTVEKILKETKIYPKFPFFVQVGGGGSGTVLNSKQLKKSLKQIGGLGSIVIHRLNESPKKLFLHWAKFFAEESCGKCVPCREGTYRLVEMLKQKKIDWPLLKDILFALEHTSFCGLGQAAPNAIFTYLKNVKDISKS